MRFSTSTCYLASIVASLVQVTTSLPQSPFGPPDGILNRELPINHQSPKNCLQVRATDFLHDVGGKGVRRDSQSSGTLARASEPGHFAFPCGKIQGGGETEPFELATAQTVRLLWNFGDSEAHVFHQLIRIVEVKPNGPDKVVAAAGAYSYHIVFNPVLGRSYYVLLSGSSQLVMTWFFAFR